MQHPACRSTHALAWLNMEAQIRAALADQFASAFNADGSIFAGGTAHFDLIDRRIGVQGFDADSANCFARDKCP